ncbi:MAG: glutamine synthetase family protein [Paracoccaceae bacterium]|nr:glutamine synthetase family protein [Paracoccaceae bacterium]MDG2257928.1 glutamine synthetase family protein [Paracoccaceae bacterium]
MDLKSLSTIRIAAPDLNGQMRGKRMPSQDFNKLADGGARMPFSALNIDITGADIENSPLVFETGDADGVLLPTRRGPLPMPWLATPSALVPMGMYNEDRSVFDGDPRHALAAVLERYLSRGWQVHAATEMEFYLVDDSGNTLKSARNPLTGRRISGDATLDLAELDAFDAFFTDLYDGCKAMGIPAQAAISEAGTGQFEINLLHRDALDAADDAHLFKALTKGIARKHGMAATFMAKPFADDAGSGMHVHFSVVDGNGKNIFDNGGPEGTDLMHHAVAGCVAAMPPSTLVFVPHGVSFDRMIAGAHAPTGAGWAYENRTAAIRIPGGSHKARRIEHRVACGDINPYLVIAAILGAALIGIEDRMVAPQPLTGNAYEQELPQLAGDWSKAIDDFESSEIVRRIFPGLLIENLCNTKRQELRRMADVPRDDLWKIYVDAS